MDLESFVKETLLQITKGVTAAKSENRMIDPPLQSVNAEKSNYKGLIGQMGTPVAMIDFDVAVTASKDTSVSGGAKGGIISVFSGNVDTGLSAKNETVTRIRFSVPLQYRDPNLA